MRELNFSTNFMITLSFLLGELGNHPQAAELRTWIKIIETKLVAYKMKSTTPIGSIMLIPFKDEVIYMANIQAQPPDNIGFATSIISDEIAEKIMHLTSEEIYEICFVKQKDFDYP
ncbi:hypothetical protein KY289_036367 [Solanum tuberosum]|nr:hypothetical protein KY289_036367 [Solanum tuberosum]